MSGLEHQVGLRLLILGGAEIFNSLENSVQRLVTRHECIFTVLDLIVRILESILKLRLYLWYLFDWNNVAHINEIALLRVSRVHVGESDLRRREIPFTQVNFKNVSMVVRLHLIILLTAAS